MWRRKAIEPDAAPMDIVIFRPNFWTLRRRLLSASSFENYVLDNWYKGGESDYSLLGRLTMQADSNGQAEGEVGEQSWR